MQTFLPYPDFDRSMSVLDRQRLGKQRVEAYQILNALAGKTKGWRNHPATRMWRGYEDALGFYLNSAIREWELRGYRNNMRRAIIPLTFKMPFWFGSVEFHLSHQSNLVRKLPEHYRQYFPNIPDNLNYVWPC